MSLLFSASHGVKKLNARRLLVSVAIVPLALGAILSEAKANDLNGVNTAAGPITNLAGANINQVAKVDTADVTSAIWGIDIWTTTGNVSAQIDKVITAAGEGVHIDTRFPGDGGDITINGAGKIDSGINGIWALADTGKVTIDGLVGGIKGVGFGILINTNGSWAGTTAGSAVNIGQTTRIGPVVATAGSGIWIEQFANATGDGDINIKASSIDATLWGIRTLGWKGKTNLDISGDINAGTAIYSTSTTGDVNINLDGNVKASVVGVVVDTRFAPDGGNIAVTGTKAVDGGAGAAFWLLSDTGNISLDGFSSIKGGNWGILVNNNGSWAGTHAGGNVNIGQNTIIGDVTSGAIGIQVAQVANATKDGDINITTKKVTAVTNGIMTTAFTGATTITTTDNVTAGNWGILSTSTNGNIISNVDGGIVSGIRGIELNSGFGTGNSTVNVAAGTTVQGTEYAVLTGTAAGVGTTNNKGTIKDTADDGLNTTVSGDAYWSFLGNGVLNNESGGVIDGRIHSNGSTTFTMNNKSGAIWNAGTLVNGFGAPGDTINNAGLINIRTGRTDFSLLDHLNNQAGGVINMQYGTNTMDDLAAIINMNSSSGSKLMFDVNYNIVPTYGDNHTSYGKGDADTIFVVKATAAGAVTVDLNNIALTSALIGTSGSIALIDAGTGLATAGMIDPGLGGLLSLLPSLNYVFGAGDPNSGAVKFVLEEGPSGGLYLRWAPNITAASLGGFFGGPLGGGPSAGGAISGASGGAGAVGGGGISGGAGGGGVAGNIADAAASSAQHNGNCTDANNQNDTHAWVIGTGSRSSFNGGGSGYDAAGTFGLEHNLGGKMGMGCGDVAIGVFATVGSFGTSGASGGQNGKDGGLGAYLKAASESGLYTSVLGSVLWTNTDMTNNVFASTAKQSGLTYLGTAAVGYTTALSDTMALDARAFASFSHSGGDAFTDTAGITVDYTSSNTKTVGFMLGLDAKLGETTKGFARVGGRWVSTDQSASAFGIVVSGSSSAFVKSIEAGFESDIGSGATLGAKAFGDFTTDSTSYGGDISLRFKI